MHRGKPSLEQAVDKGHIGLTVKLLNQECRRLFEKNAKENGLDVSPVHGRILRFLECNRDIPVYQKDIEKEFHINRSTVTSVMQVMEKNGLICRKAVEGDNRLKQVCLTALGKATCERTKEIFRETEQQLRRSLSEAELNEFLRIAQKIEHQIR